MTERLRVLFLEDRVADVELTLRALRAGGIEAEWERVETEAAFRARLEPGLDVILADHTLPGFDAPHALRILAESGLDLPFVIVTGSIGEEEAVARMREGAADYLLKDRLARLPEAVRQAVRQRRLRAALRRKEQELLRAQKLEAVGRFASGIAHDFGNLLFAIRVCTGSLAEMSGLRPALRGLVEEIGAAAERGSALVEQLAAFGRREPSVPVPLELASVVEELGVLLRRVMGSDVEILVRSAPDLAPVLADRAQLEQVLMNLAVNARDAMPEGGRLEIELGRVGAEEARRDAPGARGFGRLSVRDSGVGMDEETRRNLFEPFFTTKAPGKGSGLGLSTVYTIVSQWGGRIFVDSQPGQGTRFEIWLPLAAPPRTEAGRAGARAGRSAPPAPGLSAGDRPPPRP